MKTLALSLSLCVAVALVLLLPLNISSSYASQEMSATYYCAAESHNESACEICCLGYGASGHSLVADELRDGSKLTRCHCLA